MKMMPVSKLKKKIEKLETEKAYLNDKIKKLKLEADEKALQLQKEVGCLKEEAYSFKNLITAD